MQINSIYTAALAGIGIGIAALVLYQYSFWSSNGGATANGKKKKRRENADGDGKDRGHPTDTEQSASSGGGGDQPASTAAATGTVTSDGYTTIQVKVPKDMVGPIIGRQGVNIKQLQAETKTKIDFSKQTDESEERTITIRGSEKGTQDAELRILHIVYGQPSKEKRKLSVPQRSLGFIIGKGGETIQKIQAETGCRVNIDSKRSEDPEAMSELTLIGNEEQLDSAQMQVMTLVEEWQTKNRQVKLSKERSNPRRPAGHRTVSHVSPGSPLPVEVWPNHTDYVECYVTATVNPSHIWVQVLSPRSAKLEEINTQLSQLYSDSNNLTDDIVEMRPRLGTTVAAKNSSDDVWYRGKLMSYNDEDNTVDIYYVDYGDSCWIEFSNQSIQLLRSEYYHLPAQAVECYTDLSLHPHASLRVWSEDDSDTFETLSHTGSWTVLMGRAVSRTPLKQSHTGSGNTSGEMAVLKLIDTNGDKDVDISSELIRVLGIRNEADSVTAPNSSANSDVPKPSEIDDSNNPISNGHMHETDESHDITNNQTSSQTLPTADVSQYVTGDEAGEQVAPSMSDSKPSPVVGHPPPDSEDNSDSETWD